MPPTLILSPRYSDGSIIMRRAAIALGWDVMRLSGWRPPEDFAPEDPVLYAEPWFNDVVAEHLGLSIVAPADDFLVALPEEYVRRRVQSTSAAEARGLPGPVFLKPPNRKVFPARIYASGAELPELPDDDPILASEPVEWAAEFRYFIRDRRIRAWSPYLLNGARPRRRRVGRRLRRRRSGDLARRAAAGRFARRLAVGPGARRRRDSRRRRGGRGSQRGVGGRRLRLRPGGGPRRPSRGGDPSGTVVEFVSDECPSIGEPSLRMRRRLVQ